MTRRIHARPLGQRLAAAAACAMLSAGCGGSNAPAAQSGTRTDASHQAAATPPQRLLLVTLDTTRADRLGCYGYAPARTPCLDELAARGVLYESAWTAAPITLSSHTTILTGCYPCAHGVRENGAFEVAGDALLLSEVLQRAGLRTGAFVGSFVLDRKFGLDQGFDVYRAPDVGHLGGKWGVIDRPAGAVTDDALAFVDQLATDARFFLWVHYYDPHYPYEPPPPFATDPARAYDGEIAYCDQQLRRLLDRLRERGLDRGLVVAVTADHGESLDEHGEKTHGTFVYESTMRVPLVISPPPDGVAAGARVRSPVSIVDLAVTLLERLGIGRAALPDAKTAALPTSDDDAAATAAGDERAIYMESLSPYYAHRQAALRAVVWKGMKFISTRRSELYALGDDPHELRDLIELRADLREPLAQRLAALIAEHPPLEWGHAHAGSADDASHLRALGYAGASASGDPFGDEELPDAKDRLGDLDLVDRTAALLRDGTALLGLDGKLRPGATPAQIEQARAAGRAKLVEARGLVEQLRDGNPKDPMIPALLSSVELGLGNYRAAAAVLEELVAADPRHPMNHYNLSHAYREIGQTKWAKRELEKTAFLEPRSLIALRLLVDYSWEAVDAPATAWWLDQLLACEGLGADELTLAKRKRELVRQRLATSGESPRPPVPFAEADLLPEGRK